MNNIYYVYQLIDPRNGKPFYVGEGKENRAWTHLLFQSGCNNPHKDRVIRKIQKLGLEIEVRIVKENLTKEESKAYEEQLIEEIGLDNLTNITPNAHPPILVGEKNGFFGKTHTDENKKKLGDVNRGKDIKTDKGRESIRASLIQRWADPVKRQKQIQSLYNRRGEKRSKEAIESYKKSAALREAKVTPEQRLERSKKAIETRKVKYAGLKRKAYIDEFGRKRFKWIPGAE